MKIIYIGQYSSGTTSKMRADILRNHSLTKEFSVIDTNIPFNKEKKIWKSLGFRFKIGPLLSKINSYITQELNTIKIDGKADLIWVDKAIFITPDTTRLLRANSEKLVHYTPDMAFFKNKSNNFLRSIEFYDTLITTKSAEIELYKAYVAEENLILTTQGFSKSIHNSKIDFKDKDGSVAFIGLAESSRLLLVQYLIDNNIKVKLAGHGWESFNEKNEHNTFLQYHGKGLFEGDYSHFIASASFGLGLLSKKFPEYHTTRTFEIPACKTALLTERNKETTSFYSEDEVIFYDDYSELLNKIRYYKTKPDQLKDITIKGYNKVNHSNLDYQSIIDGILYKVI